MPHPPPPQSQSPQLYPRSSPLPPPTPPLPAHSAIHRSSTFTYPGVSCPSCPEFLPIQVAVIQPLPSADHWVHPLSRAVDFLFPGAVGCPQQSRWLPIAEAAGFPSSSVCYTFPEHLAAPQQNFLSCMKHIPVPSPLQSPAASPIPSSPRRQRNPFQSPAACAVRPIHSSPQPPAPPNPMPPAALSPAHSKPPPPAQPTPVPRRLPSPSHSSPQPPSTQLIPDLSRQPVQPTPVPSHHPSPSQSSLRPQPQPQSQPQPVKPPSGRCWPSSLQPGIPL